MPRYQTEAVVLGRLNYSNTSRIVSLFTLQLGFVKVIAKGSRRPKSAFGASLEPATEIHSEFHVKESRDIQILTGTEILNTHDCLRQDIHKLAYSCALLETVQTTSYPLQPNEPLYRMIVHCLEEMEFVSASEHRMVFWRHLMGFFGVQGFRPVLDRCVHCGNRVTGKWIDYYPKEGGISCGCRQNEGEMTITISNGALKLLLSVSSCQFGAVKNFRPRTTQTEDIEKLLMGILTYQTGRNFYLKSWRFIDSMNL